MKKTVLLLLTSVLFLQCKSVQKAPVDPVVQQKTSQNSSSAVSIYTRPKLVVGIVVDQMRYDYLTRFWGRFGNAGFKRLVAEGYLCKNHHYNYVPTYTAPGHTSIYTGTTPKNHGIISNSWYDKVAKKSIYCVDDARMQSVGTASSDGQKSPHRLKTTTISDQNRLATQFRGKTIGIALKDRSAILPAGPTANAAYWFHGKKEGKFITSSFYENELPQWVKNFNNSGKAKSYLKTWNTLKPIASYTESGNDKNNYEHGFKGKTTAAFPYNLAKLKNKNGGYDILKTTPYGNNLTTDFALAALKGEQLGQDTMTDFLDISYSTTDYIGHNFGVNSKEVEDAYLRLDQDIARLLKNLDAQVGKGNYTVFLTADHGGIEVPAFLKSKKVSAGYVDAQKLKKKINAYLGSEYGTTALLENISNHQLFFDYKVLKEKNIPAKALANNLKQFLLTYPHIYKVFTRQMLETGTYQHTIGALIQNGFNQKRSGDVVFAYDPAYISYGHKGSTHGSALNYDTQVPLIFFGKGIKHGQSTQKTRVVDIAPTLAALLGIANPNGTTGVVLSRIIDECNNKLKDKTEDAR